jgi:thiosulfate dehydrogenase [quinone] large subunit
MGRAEVQEPARGGAARASAPVAVEPQDAAARVKGALLWGLARISIGWVFLWAFLDKAFALGFSTGRLEDGTIDVFAKGQAWLNGGSPTAGVFAYGLKGPFTSLYEAIGNVTMTAQGPVANPPAWVDWVYMVSMLLIGLGLVSGIMTRIAAFGGIVWMAIFYTATSIWPEFNPFVDDHVVYAIVLAGLAAIDAGRYLGLGGSWERLPIVRRHPILR